MSVAIKYIHNQTHVQANAQKPTQNTPTTSTSANTKTDKIERTKTNLSAEIAQIHSQSNTSFTVAKGRNMGKGGWTNDSTATVRDT